MNIYITFSVEMNYTHTSPRFFLSLLRLGTKWKTNNNEVRGEVCNRVTPCRVSPLFFCASCWIVPCL